MNSFLKDCTECFGLGAACTDDQGNVAAAFRDGEMGSPALFSFFEEWGKKASRLLNDYDSYRIMECSRESGVGAIPIESRGELFGLLLLGPGQLSGHLEASMRIAGRALPSLFHERPEPDYLISELREVFRTHVYRECSELVKKRLYAIYDENLPEEEHCSRLADYFLVIARAGGELYASVGEAIYRDARSDLFLRNLMKGRFYVNQMAEGYLEQLFLILEKDHQYSNGIERAVNYIDIHFREDVSLDQAASVAQLNPFYFSRMFKNRMGCTFVSYLASRRMEEAAEMLLYTEMPVLEIAESVSFAGEAGYFSKTFKKHFGLTPTEYRLRGKNRKK